MFAAKVLVEVILVLLLAYGFWHEEEIVEWENKQIRKLIRKIERKKRAAGKSQQLNRKKQKTL